MTSVSAWPATAAAQGSGMTLTTHVTSAEDGLPLGRAIVTLVGRRMSTTTDTAGTGSLSGIPRGTHMLRVRALGYQQYNSVVVADADSVEVYVQLTRVAQNLAPMTVREERESPWLSEFYQRRRRGTGTYVGPEEIRATHGSDIATLLATKVRTVRVHGTNPLDQRAYSLRGPNSLSGSCQVAVYIDGVREPFGNAAEIPIGLLGAIEYYTPSNVPVQYREPAPVNPEARQSRGGSAACGVLLLWTGP